MTLANGSLILASDLAGMATAQLALLAADNGQLPLGLQHAFQFPGITAALLASNPERCKAVFVMPWDGYVETMAVQGGDLTAASTTTATLTCPGPLTKTVVNAPDPFPVTQSGTTGAGIVKLARIIYDGTKGRVGATYMPTNRAFRAVTRGATVTVNVTTTSVAAASMLTVSLLVRQFLGRT